MTWALELTYVEEWLQHLDDASYDLVIASLELLAERGPHLGRPLVNSVKGSRHHNMKELRPASAGRTELRVIFAFDPHRTAVALVAGDKSTDWARWYRKTIPAADKLFDEHCERITREKR